MALRKVAIRTRNIPSNSGVSGEGLPGQFEITVTDDAVGRQVEDAFRRSSDRQFEGITSHAVTHQRREDELTVREEDTGLFKKLSADGFFNVKGRKTEADEQIFNLLLHIQKTLPANEQESFFTGDGLGWGLLADVSEHHKPGPILEDDLGRGQMSDYLRRIGSILPFIPESERVRFLSEDTPILLRESKNYREFLEKTVPYLRKHAGKV
jgi:hypothetical protein